MMEALMRQRILKVITETLASYDVSIHVHRQAEAMWRPVVDAMIEKALGNLPRIEKLIEMEQRLLIRQKLRTGGFLKPPPVDAKPDGEALDGVLP